MINLYLGGLACLAASRLSNGLPAGRPVDKMVVSSTGGEFAVVLTPRNGDVVASKDRVLTVVRSLDDDASLDDVIERLKLLRKIELGIVQADQGDVMEHAQFMADLDREDVDWNLLGRGSPSYPSELLKWCQANR